MIIERLTHEHPMWNPLQKYAENCSWKAGQSLASAMEQDMFSDWECIFAAIEGNKPIGFCTAARQDCIPDLPYSPYIGYVFVDEKFRGKRRSQLLIEAAMDYLRSLGFSKVFLISDHEELYEKYGFTVVDRQPAPWGGMEKIYMHEL